MLSSAGLASLDSSTVGNNNQKSNHQSFLQAGWHHRSPIFHSLCLDVSVMGVKQLLTWARNPAVLGRLLRGARAGRLGDSRRALCCQSAVAACGAHAGHTASQGHPVTLARLRVLWNLLACWVISLQHAWKRMTLLTVKTQGWQTRNPTHTFCHTRQRTWHAGDADHVVVASIEGVQQVRGLTGVQHHDLGGGVGAGAHPHHAGHLFLIDQLLLLLLILPNQMDSAHRLHSCSFLAFKHYNNARKMSGKQQRPWISSSYLALLLQLVQTTLRTLSQLAELWWRDCLSPRQVDSCSTPQLGTREVINIPFPPELNLQPVYLCRLTYLHGRIFLFQRSQVDRYRQVDFVLHLSTIWNLLPTDNTRIYTRMKRQHDKFTSAIWIRSELSNVLSVRSMIQWI